MISDIYLLLGLPEGAPLAEVKREYARMMEALSEENAPLEHKERLIRARQQLLQSYEHTRHRHIQDAYSGRLEVIKDDQNKPTGWCRPKLGQLLVAYGLITLSELDSALEHQRRSPDEDIRLGQLLVQSGYITERQLDYYLRLQQVMQLPPDHPQRWGQRLLELGLINEDQLKVALIEQAATGCTVREALINRGWLDTEILDRVF